ncbi:Glu/Leu/Phe/Val dehydrogenase dimerization domain-containing protein [Variovorax sp. 770b2]|uniref:Leu/Phe/Val dehydrogenase n=1 Tax=Variovorax sp. 770b2 TaxID=1566271 RepID=UPI0008DF3B42|nr:Glu/Leu/Phe/Val dehydrogenase dimerization domain-containing protein [Variovorax sp. 770b2]SFQ33227.1 leucine dehydrogenase [Variovorax sp. 770b2]
MTASNALFGLNGQASHECVHWVADARSGLRAVVAIHSTSLGPAFGGCRMWHYASDQDALTDALRLSYGMSLKNALADLPFGGGKAVILKPEGDFDRDAIFGAFGAAVESLGGRYLTAEDVGSTTSDMRVVQRVTSHVSGIPRLGAFGGDPSPKTAWGVFVSIDEAVRTHLKRNDLKGVRVAVQGLGAVGASLCSFLHKEGAKLVVADIQASRVEEMRHRFGAEAATVDRIFGAAADVFAPCALGAALDSATIAELQAPIVAGAANNQLATPQDGERLQARGVMYLPDFLVNAGGIISVVREYLGTGDEHSVMQEVGRIRTRVAELLRRAEETGLSPAFVATEWARSKLENARLPNVM